MEAAGRGSHPHKRGLWTEEEDKILMEYVEVHGKGQWNRIAKKTGLKRCGKSCRLRWVNYLSPNVKKGNFTEEEEDLIIRLHKLLGNRWSLIAGRVPGRTDNQVKNYWNTHLSKRNGCTKRQRTTAMSTSSLVSLQPSKTIIPVNPEQETSAMENTIISNTLLSSHNAHALVEVEDEQNYCSSPTWREHMSSYQNLMQFSDEFDFGWSNMNSLFSG
ncbi:hypothetical protein QQ045_028965 [Rhodiola kirilowii]